MDLVWFVFQDYLGASISDGKVPVRCQSCLMGLKTGVARDQDFRENAFPRGFSKWKKTREKFRARTKSNAHKISTHNILLSREQPITAQIGGASRKEQQTNTEIFLDVLSILRGLARCGVVLRGHADTDGNLMRLFQERSVLFTELKKWLKRKTNFLSSWMSGCDAVTWMHLWRCHLSASVALSPECTCDAGGCEGHLRSA